MKIDNLMFKSKPKYMTQLDNCVCMLKICLNCIILMPQMHNPMAMAVEQKTIIEGSLSCADPEGDRGF